MPRPVLALTLTAAIALACASDLPTPHRDLPDAFQQILPRGQIAAIDHPHFVPASEADIDPVAWVLGVEIDGQARAYSLNLLNHHEVVNDTLAGRPIAAVW